MSLKIKATGVLFLFLGISSIQEANATNLIRQPLAKKIQIISKDKFNRTSEGTGSLIEVKPASIPDLAKSTSVASRFFILTAAHITKGQNTFEIWINNKRISNIKGRIFDFFNDIELIEIENKENFTPLGEVKLIPGTLGDLYLHTEVTNRDEDSYFYFKPTGEFLTPLIIVGEQFDYLLNKKMPHPSFVFFPHKLYQNYSDSVFNLMGEYNPLDIIQESSYGNTHFTPYSGLIAPGMSGAPLIQFKRIGDAITSVIDGVTMEYYRFGSKSLFTNSKVITDLIKNYVGSELRGSINTTQWNVNSDGTSYREINKYCLSKSLLNNASDNSTSSSRDNAKKPACHIIKESSLPIKSVGSGGVRGDGSDSFQEKSYQDWTSSVSSLLIDGQEVYGFKVASSDSAKPIYIESNWAALDYLIKNSWNKNIEIVRRDANFVDLFLNHYLEKRSHKIEFPFTIEYKSNPNVKVVVNQNTIDFSLPGVIIDRSKEDSPLNRDKIRFQVNTKGEATSLYEPPSPGKKFSFASVIKVKGYPSGLDYYVDIRQLFFIDLYEVPKNPKLHSEIYNLDLSKNPTLDEVIQATYFKGPVVTINLVSQRINSTIIQLYLP